MANLWSSSQTSWFHNWNEITIDACQTNCQGFKYFGMGNGQHCNCGNTMPDVSLRLEARQCDKSCSGDQTQQCGGHHKWNIFTVSTPTTTTTTTTTTPTTTSTTTTTDSEWLLTPEGKHHLSWFLPLISNHFSFSRDKIYCSSAQRARNLGASAQYV